jgi:hypothetical protein
MEMSMQNKDKQRLKKQLEQEAKKLPDIDGNEMVISLISTCNALLKISEKCLDKNDVPNEVYAVYLSFVNRIKAFYDLYSKNTDLSNNIAYELQELLDMAQVRQSEQSEIEEHLLTAKKNNEELQMKIDMNSKSLKEQKAIGESLHKMSLNCTPEMIEEQKKKNDDILSYINNQKKLLSALRDNQKKMLNEKQQLEEEVREIEDNIKMVPEEIVLLRKKYKELEALFTELENAEVEYSVKRQMELRKNIDELTPIVEENKVATEILQNRKESLENQKTKYDRERKVLTTDLIDIVTDSLEQLRSIMSEHNAFLDKTEATAKILAENLDKCLKKRDEYRHWFDAVETPLETMLKEIGYPENTELRKTLNINQMKTIRTCMENIRRNLKNLDNILSVCAMAAQKDLQIIKKRAGQ